MHKPRLRIESVVHVVENALGAPPAITPEWLDAGYANDNWRVTLGDGSQYIVKFGFPSSAPKWRAARVACDVAESVGVSAPRLVHLGQFERWLVRIFEWIDGVSPLAAPVGEVFFADLGTAVGRLHTAPVEWFSSRLDGSAPRFQSWPDYVSYRWSQIAGRVSDSSAFSPAEFAGLTDRVDALASSIEHEARPAVCHRDLYLDNLLATSDGKLAAILDFDMAEAWDQAADFVRLRWMVAPPHPDAERSFSAAYHSIHPRTPGWDERVLLAELLELVNAVANACTTEQPTFEADARGRLTEVLG